MGFVSFFKKVFTPKSHRSGTSINKGPAGQDTPAPSRSFSVPSTKAGLDKNCKTTIPEEVEISNGGSSTSVESSGSSAVSPVRRHSSTGASNPKTVLQLVARSDASGKPISQSTTPTHRRAKTGFPRRKSFADSQYHVEEIHPSLVSPQYNPNDVILLYRDLAELTSSMVCPSYSLSSMITECYSRSVQEIKHAT